MLEEAVQAGMEKLKKDSKELAHSSHIVIPRPP